MEINGVYWYGGKIHICCICARSMEAISPILRLEKVRNGMNDVVLAGAGARLVAKIIDSCLLVLIVAIMIGIASFAEYEEDLYITLGLFIGLISYALIQTLLLSRKGQTIGKQMLNIKIVKYSDQSNGGFVHNVLLRSIVNGIIGIIPLYSLVDVLFICSWSQRCLHDHIAGTTVVKVLYKDDYYNQDVMSNTWVAK